MVVNHYQRRRPETQRRSEDFAGMDETGGQSADRDQPAPEHTVAGIEIESDKALAIRLPQIDTPLIDVGRMSERGATGAIDSAAQFQGQSQPMAALLIEPQVAWPARGRLVRQTGKTEPA